MLRFRHAIALTFAGTLTLAAAASSVLQDMQMPTPTQEHNRVQKAVGVWKGTITMYMPGMPETASPATETVRSAGPFWTISDFKSEFMGMEYMGHGCHGYDPAKGKYVSTWIDNMSSYLAVMEGTYDDATEMMTTHWDAPDMTGKMAAHRAEQSMSDDAYTMTFFTADKKTMVIDMKRTSTKAVEAGVGGR